VKGSGRAALIWDGMSMREGNMKWAARSSASSASNSTDASAPSHPTRLQVSDAKFAVVVEVISSNAFVSIVPAKDYIELRGYALPHTAM